MLSAEPQHADALSLLGTLLHQQGKHEEALVLIRRAIELRPAAAGYRCNLAAVLGRAGRKDAAVAAASEAVRLAPTMPEAHNNLGVALESVGRLAAAGESYVRAIALKRDYAEAHHNLGNVLRKLGRVEEALVEHEVAIRLRPGYAKAQAGRALSLAELGSLDGVIEALRSEIKTRPSAAVHSSLLYTLHYHAAYGPAELLAEHREWDHAYGQQPRQAGSDWDDRGGNKRLRVGYLSPDLREHTVPRFVGHAFDHRDRDAVEVVAYSDSKREDPMTAWLRQRSDLWRQTATLSDEALEKLIREDRIDILVDLRGHGGDNRLPVFARKPAPVQVSMVGYFDTTGLAAMDWRITDALQDPAGMEAFHTERLARLAGGCWCYRPDDAAPAVGILPADRNRRITFGSLNKFIKVTAAMAHTWRRILEAVPGSVLLVAVVGGNAGGVARRRLARLGLPEDRLVIVDKTATLQQYLARFNEIDICLDTNPFCGITTTCDSLWMGCPVVTMSGSTSVSRAGKSILQSAGLSELCAASFEHYVQVAVELARDVPRLRSQRRGLREQVAGSALADGRTFAACLERTYREMWSATSKA